jgi:acyl-[acyl-carrier-protein]-phospholipid O-acyltransferase/long-chain-fatty-acid--[acyl-carrier-protein] ligase
MTIVLRGLLWLFTHSVYWLKVEGREHVPRKGGALFVCNHLSLADALVQASANWLIRFIVFKDIYERPPISPARLMRAIPISSQRPREMIHALRGQRASSAAIRIFAEGR